VPSDRDIFIRAMRSVATSVTVVTTEGPSGVHGATVSSFTSLSADPPSVLVCLRTQSRIARAVSQNGVFCVNVLSERDRTTADTFAGRFDDTRADRFADIHCRRHTGHGPVIGDSTAFACEVQGVLEHASHTVFIGRVDDVNLGKDLPLTYLDGQYRSMSQPTNH
jgi:flavin reductase (DIM6/NTAB) family NADH-FMN oxidoreductase RutF